METYLFTLARYLPDTPTLQFHIQADSLEEAIEALAYDDAAVNYGPRHVQVATWAPAVVSDGKIETVEKRHLIFDVWASEILDGESWLAVAQWKAESLNATEE